jgi:hypothetical protein
LRSGLDPQELAKQQTPYLSAQGYAGHICTKEQARGSPARIDTTAQNATTAIALALKTPVLRRLPSAQGLVFKSQPHCWQFLRMKPPEIRIPAIFP